MRAVVGNLGRRAMEALVLLFALLGFVFVPLGKKTGLDHALAIVSTRAVTDAVRETAAALARARERLFTRSAGDAPRKAERRPASALSHAAPRDAGADVSLTGP
jgi:hypothetical protein